MIVPHLLTFTSSPIITTSSEPELGHNSKDSLTLKHSEIVNQTEANSVEPTMCNNILASWRCGCVRFSDWTLCETAAREGCEFATSQLLLVEANMCTGCREEFLALPSAQRFQKLLWYNGQTVQWNRMIQDESARAEQ